MNHRRDIFNARTFSALFVVCSGVLFYVLLSHFDVVSAQLGVIAGVFSPFVLGLVLAFLLNLPMRFFEAKLFHRTKHKRIYSMLLSYFLALFGLYALGAMVVPQLVDSLMQLLGNVQLYVNNVNTMLENLTQQFNLDEQIMDLVQESYSKVMLAISSAVSTILPQVVNWSFSVGRSVFSIFTGVIASIYLLLDKDKLLFLGKRLIYALAPASHTDRILDVLRRTNAVFSGFIAGKIIDSFIIAILCFIGMSFIYSDLALLISVIIGVTNIIPVFGPFIGAIPSIFLLLIINPISALWFALFILFLQQIDGNIIGPKILGESTGLSALWVLIAIVVGGGLFGLPGMLVGVPLCSVLAYLLSDALAGVLARKGLRTEGTEILPVLPPEEEPPAPEDNR